MDLSYSDEDGFENYIPTTTDPGPWLFGGTALYSVGCIVMIPILVTIKKKRIEKQKRERVYQNNDTPPALVGCQNSELGMIVSLDGCMARTTGEVDASFKEEEESSVGAESEIYKPSEEDSAPFQGDETFIKCRSQKERILIDGGDSSILQRGEEEIEIFEGNIRNGEVNSSHAEHAGNIDEAFHDSETQPKANDTGNCDETQTNNEPVHNLQQSDQLSCPATIFGCTLQQFIVSTKAIVKYDKESKRILRLAGPFVMSEVSQVLFWALTTLLVSRYTDVDQLSAYIVTDLLVGTSETLIKGFLETLETVCSHAVGYGNNKLAGQYVQIVAALYSIFSIPLFGMWWFVMEPALRWFGLDTAAVDIGIKYTKVLIFNYYLDGIFTAVGAIPDVTNKERATNIYKVSHEVIEFAVVWILFAKVEEFDLFWMGVLQLISTLIGLVGFTAVTVKLGWFDPYWEGLTKSCTLKNKTAVKYVMKMALPLSIGALFEYGEWELLTIFAASMGQAELAAWGLMESIWDLLEAFAEGFGNAGAVRVALQLGRGNIPQAKLSAWKSLFLVTILGLVITIAYGFLGDYIAVLYTSDETLQGMLKSMVPIVAFGNVFQAFGSMAWGLVGGQGRYHHATIVSSTITMTVSIPLAAFFSLAMDFPLESLVAALVIGYSTVSMCLSYLLITSDWKFISDKIIEEMDDSSSSSSSSSDDDTRDEEHGNDGAKSLENHENNEGSKPSSSSPSFPSSSSSTSSITKRGEASILIDFRPQDETDYQSKEEGSGVGKCSSSSTSTFDGFASKFLQQAANVTGNATIQSTLSAKQKKEFESYLTTPMSVDSKGGSCLLLSSSNTSSLSTGSSSESKKDCLSGTMKDGGRLSPNLPYQPSYQELGTDRDKTLSSPSSSSISSSDGLINNSATSPTSRQSASLSVAITHKDASLPFTLKSGSPLSSRSSLYSSSTSETDAHDKTRNGKSGFPRSAINKNDASLVNLRKSENGSSHYSSSVSSSSSSKHASPSVTTKRLYSF